MDTTSGTLLWWTAQNLVVTGALAALVWLTCYAGRIGPVGRHALWLLVLLKLLTPPLLAWPWAVQTPWPTGDEADAGGGHSHFAVAVYAGDDAGHARPALAADEVILLGSLGISESAEPLDATVPPPAYEPPPAPAAVAPRPPVQASHDFSVEQSIQWLAPVAAGVWVAGSVAFTLVQLASVARMLRRMRRGTAADDVLLDHVEHVAARLGVRAPAVRVVRGIGSPAVWALMRPVLLWPAEMTADTPGATVRALVAHELAHVKRRDHWVGWLELLAGCLWWWNPLYWYARHQVRENAELACDAWVVDAMPAHRRAYAEGLIAVCECMSRRPAPMPALGFGTGGRRFLERRLTMILRERTPLRLPRAGMLAVVLLALTALPVWSQKTDGGSGGGSDAGNNGTELPGVGATAVFELSGSPAVEPGGPTVEAKSPKFNGLGVSFRELPGEGANDFRVDRPLPAEASALVDGFERQQAQARAQLAEQLMRLSARYTHEGRADEAAAVAAQAERLQADCPGLTAHAVGVKHGLPGLMGYRDRVGQHLLFSVVGTTDGHVWGGPDAYTDDSALGTAAVHAGVVKPGERKVVRVEILPGRESFEGSTRNGVTSQRYHAWPGAYRVAEAAQAEGALRDYFGWSNVPPAPAPELHNYGPVRGQIAAAHAAADPGNLTAYRGRAGQTFLFQVTGSLDGSVWGDGVYTDDSSLAAAAVHAGAVAPGRRGLVRVTILPGRAEYAGAARNGVTSSRYGEWTGSFTVEPARVYRVRVGEAVIDGGERKADPEVGRVNVNVDAFPGTSNGEADGRVAVAAGGRLNLGQYRGKPGTTLVADVTGSTAGTVWGTDEYTDDSDLATAAVHAGVLREGERGWVNVTTTGARDSYEGSTRNGVTSRRYLAWPGGFRVERGADAGLGLPPPAAPAPAPELPAK